MLDTAVWLPTPNEFQTLAKFVKWGRTVFRGVRDSFGGAKEIRKDVRRLTDRRLQASLFPGGIRCHQRLEASVLLS